MSAESSGSSRTSTGAKSALRSPGLWLFVGGLEILFLIHISEFLYPGYSVSDDYISDLGVGPDGPRVVFTFAVILFGVAVLVAGVLLRQANRKSMIWALLILTGIGAVGVGVFNEDILLAHRPSAFMAFFFGNLSAVYSHRLVRPPLSYIFVLLGLTGLIALALYGSGTYLGFGVGGIERMILYPALFWAIGFGAYQMAEEKNSAPAIG